MSITWQELIPVRMARAEAGDMFRGVSASDFEGRASYMDRYREMPEELQCALGYVRCLVESSTFGSHSAYYRQFKDWIDSGLGRIPSMRLPFRFLSWGGEYGDLGPVYEVDGGCFFDAGSRLFYSDDDIQDRRDWAEELAQGIAAESSGISHVRAELLPELRTVDGGDGEERWCVTFRLDEGARRDVTVGDERMRAGENGSSLFVLARSGEFNCVLGEVVGGDADDCFVLSTHSYCMK